MKSMMIIGAAIVAEGGFKNNNKKGETKNERS